VLELKETGLAYPTAERKDEGESGTKGAERRTKMEKKKAEGKRRQVDLAFAKEAQSEHASATEAERLNVGLRKPSNHNRPGMKWHDTVPSRDRVDSLTSRSHLAFQVGQLRRLCAPPLSKAQVMEPHLYLDRKIMHLQ
jgi:hypothetical protein